MSDDEQGEHSPVLVVPSGIPGHVGVLWRGLASHPEGVSMPALDAFNVGTAILSVACAVDPTLRARLAGLLQEATNQRDIAKWQSNN